MSNLNVQAFRTTLEQTLGFSASRAQAIVGALGPQPRFRSPLQFFRRSGMTPEEFAAVAPALRAGSGTNAIEGRININTAPAAVLSCLPGMTLDLAETLVSFREMSPDRLLSIAWIVEALGENNAAVLSELETEDCLTTESYQYSADIAAVGRNGRGYRRTRFVFDVSSGTPQIIYRQDLSFLGWALGKRPRDEILTQTALR